MFFMALKISIILIWTAWLIKMIGAARNFAITHTVQKGSLSLQRDLLIQGKQHGSDGREQMPIIWPIDILISLSLWGEKLFFLFHYITPFIRKQTCYTTFSFPPFHSHKSPVTKFRLRVCDWPKVIQKSSKTKWEQNCQKNRKKMFPLSSTIVWAKNLLHEQNKS